MSQNVPLIMLKYIYNEGKKTCFFCFVFLKVLAFPKDQTITLPAVGLSPRYHGDVD